MADIPDTTSAMNQVLTTYELLESILLELPLRDVLLAQRVSETFKDIINNSLPLQRQLFLAPISNCLLVDQPMNGVFLTTRSSCSERPTQYATYTGPKFTINPFIAQFWPHPFKLNQLVLNSDESPQVGGRQSEW